MLPTAETILQWANKVPLEQFAFIGSFFEELISQIPSPVILVTAGSIIHAKGGGWAAVILISVIASAGKTIASMLYYLVAHTSEEFIVTRVGYRIGITHEQIKKASAYFTGSRKDDFIIFTARAIPIMPTTLVSVLCGILHISIGTYAAATFAGYFFRCLLLTYLGFIGIRSVESFSADITVSNTTLYILLAILLVANILWQYYRKDAYGVRTKVRGLFKKTDGDRVTDFPPVKPGERTRPPRRRGTPPRADF